MAPGDDYQIPIQESRDCGNRSDDLCIKYRKFKAIAALFPFLCLYIVALILLKKQIQHSLKPSSPVLFGISLAFASLVLSSLPREMLSTSNPTVVALSSSGGMAGIYSQSILKQSFFQRLLMSSFTFLARSGLLILAWLVINLLVPQLFRLTFLGSPLWKWSLLAFTITSGYFAVQSIWSLLNLLLNLPSTRYYFLLGLMPSTNLVMHFVLLLICWLLYFCTEHGLKHASTPHPQAFEYVTWTIVSLLVGSILFFVKTFVLLKWSVDAIYGRFEPRLLITGVKFMYLGVLIGGFFENLLLDKIFHEPDIEGATFRFTNCIMSRKSNMLHLEKVGQILTSLATLVRQLDPDEDGVPGVVQILNKNITKANHHDVDKCELDSLSELLRGPGEREPFLNEGHRKKMANVLYVIVREECGSDEFTFYDLKKSMEEAHKNCVNMGRTLMDATAIVTHLDIFLSFIILFVVILLWLLITGVATTTILVTVATPVLALTFIFGDSAKAFFQGIIFCFATHAFDVGDRCIVDEIELEVKSIGILTTTFTKIGTMEKRMYPNSLLATKAIANLGWQPNPTDIIELTLDISTAPEDLQILKTKLDEFFNDPREKGFKNEHVVMTTKIGDKITVIVDFTHVLNIKEMTHGQCLLKKNQQRSHLLNKIYQFLDHKSPTKPKYHLHDPPANTSEIVELRNMST